MHMSISKDRLSMEIVQETLRVSWMYVCFLNYWSIIVNISIMILAISVRKI